MALVQRSAPAKKRGHQVLEDTNLKLTSVVTELFGVSGRRLLAAWMAGERAPQALAGLALGRLRRKLPPLAVALPGPFTPHHATLIQAALALVDLLHRQSADLESQMGALGAPWEPQSTP